MTERVNRVKAIRVSRRLSAVVLVGFLVAMLLSACSGKPAAPAAQAPAPPAAKPAAPAAQAPAPPLAKPAPAAQAQAQPAAKSAPAQPAKVDKLVFNTGPTGGGFYAAGAVLGEMMNKYGSNITVASVATPTQPSTPIELSRGSIHLGLNTADVVFHAQRGTRDFEKVPPIKGLRLVSGGYRGGAGFVTMKKTRITEMSQLAGKVGAMASPVSIAQANAFLEFYGLTEKGKLTLKPGYDFPQAIEDVRAGTIQFTWFTGEPPPPLLMEWATTDDLVFLSLSPEAANHVATKYPYWTPVSVRAGTYRGQDKDWVMGGFFAALISHENVPEDTIYRAVKALWDHTDEAKRMHSGAGDFNAKTTLQWVKDQIIDIPLHAGTERYLREKGLLR